MKAPHLCIKGMNYNKTRKGLFTLAMLVSAYNNVCNWRSLGYMYAVDQPY